MVEAGSHAEEAGLQAGDSIIGVAGTSALYFDELLDLLADNKGEEVTLNVIRGGSALSLNASVSEEGKLGFKPQPQELPTQVERYGFFQSIPVGISKGVTTLTDYVKSIWRLITADLPADKSLNGPIGIGAMFGAEWDWQRFWALTGLLSMILAVANLLPIPALDGGHVLFLLVEMIRRKPLSYRFLEVTQTIGMVIIILLMGFAFYNDITNIILKN